MTTSASVFYNKIDVNYPFAGRDNDSQGFRDNFNNVKLAIKSTDDLVDSLSLNSVKTDSEITNFSFNTIKRANFEDCSVSIFDDSETVRSQSVTVNYTNGSYQKFLVGNGITVFSVINWPFKSGKDLCGNIVLSITPDNAGNTVLDFGDYVPVGETTVPFQFDSDLTVFFELWTDDGGATVYVNQIGYKTGIVATGTTLIATNSIKIGTNTYRTGTNYKTVIYAGTGTDIQVGDVAILKNVYRTTIDPATSYMVGSTLSNYFVVDDGTGIFKGATVNFTGTNTAYVVDSIVASGNTLTNTATVFTTSSFSINPAPFNTGSVVVFGNPQFTDLPIPVIFTTATISSTTGTQGDFKGTIYANSSSLYVAYEDYSVTATNWVKFYDSNYIDTNIDTANVARQLAAGTTAITVSTSTDNQVLATTEFVHNVLPKQSIIMWGGQPNQIPWGWALCDGQTVNSVVTPDLRNRFIIGASTATGTTATTSITGSATETGGSKDAVLVQHTHLATVTEEPHSHTYKRQPEMPNFGDDGAADGPSVYGINNQVDTETTTATTGIEVGISTEGFSGTNTNLPPYFALCYIMKVI